MYEWWGACRAEPWVGTLVFESCTETTHFVTGNSWDWFFLKFQIVWIWTFWVICLNLHISIICFIGSLFLEIFYRCLKGHSGILCFFFTINFISYFFRVHTVSGKTKFLLRSEKIQKKGKITLETRGKKEVRQTRIVSQIGRDENKFLRIRSGI